MKKFFLGLIALIALPIFIYFYRAKDATSRDATSRDATSRKIFIIQTVDHIALNQTTQGIIDALEKHGLKKGENLILKVESAQGNPALAGHIASSLVNQHPDLVVGVGTLASQALAPYALKGKTRLVFTSVTDPYGAGLAQLACSEGAATSQITGVSNFIDLKQQLELFKRLQPTLTRLGILFNPGETNSVMIVKKLTDLCLTMGITLITQAINRTADIAHSAVKIAHDANAIFISNDNTALSGLSVIIKAAYAAHIPVYVSDTDAVSLGALAALGPSQYDLGLQTGALIIRLLNGSLPAQEKIEYPQKIQLIINKDTAKTLGIIIPDDIVNSSDQQGPLLISVPTTNTESLP